MTFSQLFYVLKLRTSLRGLYVLVDARHGFKWSDHEWLSELGSAGPMKQVGGVMSHLWMFREGDGFLP